MKEYRDLLAEGQRDKIDLCSKCDAYKDLDDSHFKKVEQKSRSDQEFNIQA